MTRFAEVFSIEEISSQLVGQIPWGTINEIMQKSKSHDEMLWYINETHKHGWSRSIVLHQIELRAYERSLIEPTTTPIVRSNDLTNELFKETYVFDVKQ